MYEFYWRVRPHWFSTAMVCQFYANQSCDSEGSKDEENHHKFKLLSVIDLCVHVLVHVVAVSCMRVLNIIRALRLFLNDYFLARTKDN